jgi:hypothetical protein
MVPDLASISPLKLDFLLDMSAKDGPKIRDLHLNMSTKDYQAEVKGEFTAPEVSASLEFKNYKHLMTDFMGYLDRLAQKGRSIEIMQSTIATLKFTVMLVDRIINQLGSYSADGSTLSIKGSYNLTSGQSFVNGKPLEEIMGLLQQQMQTIIPDTLTGEQGHQAKPAQPGVPELPTQPKQQMVPENQPQSSSPDTTTPQTQKAPELDEEIESQDFPHPSETPRENQPSEIKPG